MAAMRTKAAQSTHGGTIRFGGVTVDERTLSSGKHISSEGLPESTHQPPSEATSAERLVQQFGEL